MEYKEIDLEGDKGSERLLDSPEGASANVILIKTNKMENSSVNGTERPLIIWK